MLISKKESINKFNIIIALLFLGLYNLVEKRIEFEELTTPQRNTVSPEVLTTINFGAQKLISSLMWSLSLLQSDLLRKERSERSWFYYRVDVVSHLDPLFLENYIYGGLLLSIINDDVYGADEIFTKGLRLFPDNKFLLWYKGFNLCYEIKKCDEALEYFVHLNNIKMPHEYVVLPSIISNIYSKKGELNLGFQILYNEYLSQKNEEMKKHIARSLYSMKAAMDLKCLNAGLQNCDLKDFFGDNYQRDQNGNWFSKEPVLKKHLSN